MNDSCKLGIVALYSCRFLGRFVGYALGNVGLLGPGRKL